MNQQENEQARKRAAYREAGRFLGMGVNLAVTIVLFVYLGSWLDGHYNKKEPFYLLICSGFGLFAGLYHFIKSALQLEKKAKK